ncbi:dolichol-phosphate mannosyltransferase [Spirosoma lacussanchae]|uniref:glycosyltransferase family 2 protein n=1 Tax=Spirosoma lacussanchae TaxID=1884249 RepID=UPI0011085DE5|nr:glycosyltransferase family 2 protein [Spirosoma lacussanchae]
MNAHSISVIIPCFNEQQVIRETYMRLTRVMQANFSAYELLFVNDGSRDYTLSILKELASQDEHVHIISLSRNFGHQPAVSAGIENCTGDLAIIIDADLQDPPELIPDMVRMYEAEGCNVVYAVRKQRQGETVFKRVTAKWFYRIINYLSEVPLPVDTGDFRLIDRKVIDAFNRLEERNKYIRGLISWVGFKQVPIYYERAERFAGETKYPLSKMLKFARTSLLYFSNKPLRLASSIGIFSVIIALCLTMWVLYTTFFLPDRLVQGWSSTLIVVMFFGGTQMLTVGILGEYLGSIFNEIKKRPEFIIDEKVNSKPPATNPPA